MNVFTELLNPWRMTESDGPVGNAVGSLLAQDNRIGLDSA